MDDAALAPPDSRWLELAAEVGVLVAPAGLDFVVGSATWWLYSVDAKNLADLVPRPWVLHPTKARLPLSAEALRHELPQLRDIDARRRAALARSRLQPPRARLVPVLLRRLETVSRELPEFALRDFVLRSAALLDAMRLIAEYHRPGGPEPGYVHDMLENGLTFLHVRQVDGKGVAVARQHGGGEMP